MGDQKGILFLENHPYMVLCSSDRYKIARMKAP